MQFKDKNKNEDMKITICEQSLTLGKQLGKGQHGNVFLAKNDEAQPVCVVKTEISRARAEREMEAINLFYTPFRTEIVERDGIFYFSMPYFPGETLKDLQKKGLSFYEKLVIAEQLQHQLMALHEKGILHRDIKADNIMVSIDKNNNINVNIIDLGRSARLESMGMLSLTTNKFLLLFQKQVAPEFIQNKPERIGVHSDIYSYGKIFQTLFPDEIKTIKNLTGEPATRYQSYQELSTCIEKMIENKVAEMISQCNEFLNEEADVNSQEYQQINALLIQFRSVNYTDKNSLRQIIESCDSVARTFETKNLQLPQFLLAIKKFFDNFLPKSKKTIMRESIQEFSNRLRPG